MTELVPGLPVLLSIPILAAISAHVDPQSLPPGIPEAGCDQKTAVRD